MSQKLCCPQCGHTDLQVMNETNVESKGKDYSAGKGCLGYLMFGPLGAMCGSCGSGKKITTTNTTYWCCPKCGKKFRSPDDLRKDKELNKKTFISLIVAGIILPIVAAFSVSKDLGMGGSILFGVILCIAIMAFAYIFTKRKNDKIEAEARELEANMKRFQNL